MADVLLPPKVPTLERVQAVRVDSQKIGEFLDWLIEMHNDAEVADLHVDKLLHEYFEIDPEKEENEKRELLAYQRLLNARTDIRKELGLA